MLERDKRESGRGYSETLYFMGETGELPDLNVSRQDLLIHLVKVGWREGKSLRSEESKVIEVDFVMSRGKKVTRVFTVLDQNFCICVEASALE
jgi:hypothetical protein